MKTKQIYTMNLKFDRIARRWMALILACVLCFSTFMFGGVASSSGLTITSVDPTSAPNDLDTAITITGAGFENGATVELGTLPLTGVQWISATQLQALVPWGLSAGAYDLAVTNPGGATASLPAAFTVDAALNTWNSTALFGGRVETVQYNPVDPNTLYAVSFEVGLFRSRDGGATWSYISAGMAEALAIDPLTPTRLYMHNERSEDEGATWTTMNVAWGWPHPHPSIPGRVYMTVSDPAAQPGIYRSTNYGDFWTPIMNGLTDLEISTLAFHPTDANTLYAGSTSGKLFVSTDGGDNWTFASQPLDDIEALAVNPNGAHEVWAANCCFCSPGQTVKSTTPDLSAWSTVDAGLGTVAQISFAPSAWGAAYDQTVFLTSCGSNIGRSSDGGATWENLRPNLLANDWHHLALHPTNPQIYTVASSKDGAYQTGDAGATWQIANQGLSALIPNQLEAAPGQPQTAFAFTANGLYKTLSGGQSWSLLNADYSNPLAVDPDDSNHLYAVSDSSYGWGLAISHDGGLTWLDSVFTPMTDPYADYNAALAWTIRFKPGQPSTMLASANLLRFGTPPANAGTIYTSTDSGLTWTRATLDGQPGAGNHIRDLAFDLQESSIAYAATEESGLFRSADSGATWQRVGAANSDLDHGSALAVEPAAPYRVYVSTYGGIYVSADHGLTWSLAPGPLSDPRVAQLLFTAETPPVLYAATEQGLYRSMDGSVSWSRAPGALGQVPVKSLATEQNGGRTIVYAGTSGGSIAGGSTSGPEPGSRLASSDELIDAGVYRYTETGAEPEALPAWELANLPGFGDGDNTNVNALEVFKGWLYAGTWNSQGPAQVWRAADGRNWSQVTPSWVSANGSLMDLTTFGAYLYAGTSNASGGELWRSDGNAWEQVASGGFNDATNTSLEHLAAFENMLYVATGNSSGISQIWRSPTGAAGSWEKVKDDLGGVMQAFNGYLYVGGSRNGKAELWRSDDGASWAPVFSDGLGDENTHVTALAEFKGELYIGLRNTSTSGQVWRSANGVDWTPAFKFGLGNPDNGRPYGLIASNDHLYVVFTNLVTGVEVWRTGDGAAWSAVGKAGLGDSLNTWADYWNRGAALFNHDLYIGTLNLAGGQVRRLELAQRVFLPVVH